MPVRFLDEELGVPTKPRKKKIRFLDEQTVSQEIDKKDAFLSRPEDAQDFEFTRSLVSGLSTIPRGLAQLSNIYLRPALTGQEPLSQEELGQRLQKIGIEDFEPQTLRGGIAKFAAEALPFLAVPQARLAQLGTLPRATAGAGVGATEGAITGGLLSAAEGEDPVSGAITGAVTGGVVAGTLPIAGAAFKKIQPALGEVLSKVPRETLEEAFNIIKKGEDLPPPVTEKGAKQQFDKLGKKAREALNFLEKREGKLVGEQKALLQNRPEKIDPFDILERVENIENQFIVGKTNLLDTPQDQKSVEWLKNAIIEADDEGIALVDLQALKQRIQKRIKKQRKDVTDPPSSELERLYKQTANYIDEKLTEFSPELKQANLAFSEIANLREELSRPLSPQTSQRTIEAIEKKPIELQQQLQRLDALAPENLKFLDEAQMVEISRQLSKKAPSLGASVGSLAGAVGFGAFNPYFSAPFLAALIQSSPRVQRELIRGYGAARQLTPVIPRGTVITQEQLDNQ